MPTVDVERTRAADIVEQIAAERFSYPNADHPSWQTFVNVPNEQIGIQVRGGGWIYPDIVVVEEPGHFIELLGLIALRHEVTETTARKHWLPLSKAGPLYLFVPAGQAGRANRLCNELGIPLAGIRAWRWTRAFGLEVEEAYTGVDVGGLVAAILPPFLRSRSYQRPRREQEAAYSAPAARTALPAGTAALLEAGAATEEHAFHTAPPSPFPILIGLGAALTAFGMVFPAELLGAGLATAILGTLGWLWEDILNFTRETGGAGGHDDAAPAAAQHEAAADLPEGFHTAPPSWSPIIVAIGAVMTAFGMVFPAELLGAGLTLAILGTLGWLGEDIKSFATGH